jgi:hypothetical protein
MGRTIKERRRDMKKYEMIKEGMMFRLVAIRDFGNVAKGERGGLIEKETNLSHDGNCWVYGNARVYGNAWVYGDAWVYGNARVYGNAWVYGNARVYGDAWVYGGARVYGDAEVYDYHRVQFGELKDNSIKSLIASSLNVYPVNGIYHLYKRVNKIEKGKYASDYDPSFLYEDGKTAEVKNINIDTSVSCGDGLHVSTPFYWRSGDTLIAVEIMEEDIICCQEGKLRVKKLKVIGEVI